MEKFITNSFEETQNAGAEFARQILRQNPLPAGRQGAKQAVVLALSGDLGAGKTTFLQGFAKGLGIKENILSPTFIIMKKFKIPPKTYYQNERSSTLVAKYFYHFDLYRLESKKDLEFLDFQEIISNPENIMAIEWPEKISTLLPKAAIKIDFKHLEENKRELTVGR